MSISGVSSSSTYASYATSSASNKRGPDFSKLFSEIDTDGSGSLNSDELQSLIDKAPQSGSGSSVSSADMLKKLDTDGDGSVSKDELSSGLKAMHDQLSSQFQQMRMQAGGMPPPPPPEDGSDSDDNSSVSASDATGSTSSASSTSSNSKLDELFKKMDTDGDGSISQSEFDTFAQQMQAQGNRGHHHHRASSDSSSTSSDGSSTSSTSSADSSTSSSSGDNRLAFISRLLQQYTSGVSASASSDSSQLTVSA